MSTKEKVNQEEVDSKFSNSNLCLKWSILPLTGTTE
ncbi:uncharacterized protein G2W53_019059 [Senna tora]|uniref:Uncharacterized protein n=1 Tax=Senna tora TaxID=362788 RepID=A0A834TSX2_9FABA|nr:uncharacterized protein G2W53_019059 [Senna tora]